MRVCLLHKEQEYDSRNSYLNKEDVIKDLNLDRVFEAMAKEDWYVYQIVRNVVVNPLQDIAAIHYRQEMVKECVEKQEAYRGFYRIATRAVREIESYREKVQRREKGKMPHAAAIYSSLEILLILVRNMEELMEHVSRTDAEYSAAGMVMFCRRMRKGYNARFEEEVKRSIKDMVFLNNGGKIHLNASLGRGMRGSEYSVAELLPVPVKSNRGFSDKVKRTYYRLFQRNVLPLRDSASIQDASKLEQGGLYHVLTMYQGFIAEYTSFFENLRFQTAYYVGCMGLYNKMRQLKLQVSMPVVNLSEGKPFCFKELYELGLALAIEEAPVPNDLDVGGRNFIIISGANQGGKSTFLRSIGVAQVLMQCGMFVPAAHYANQICDNVFTHFSRREDQSLNSGRLDEELKRMKRIIMDITPRSMLLLNESFASTTEKEGSVIAGDITKALYEEGICVFMVTHLYEFVKSAYERKWGQVAFLCAQRNEDGTRTFRLLEAEPSYTSYGMDLYKEIIGNA